VQPRFDRADYAVAADGSLRCLAHAGLAASPDCVVCGRSSDGSFASSEVTCHGDKYCTAHSPIRRGDASPREAVLPYLYPSLDAQLHELDAHLQSTSPPGALQNQQQRGGAGAGAAGGALRTGFGGVHGHPHGLSADPAQRAAQLTAMRAYCDSCHLPLVHATASLPVAHYLDAVKQQRGMRQQQQQQQQSAGLAELAFQPQVRHVFLRARGDQASLNGGMGRAERKRSSGSGGEQEPAPSKAHDVRPVAITQCRVHAAWPLFCLLQVVGFKFEDGRSACTHCYGDGVWTRDQLLQVWHPLSSC
jgi:hypothetical protein